MKDQFYQDEPYFKDPDGLNQIFDDLQEQNLSYINKIQEVEQQLEVVEYRRIKLSKRLELEKSKQEQSQTKVESTINDALQNLDNLKKNSSGMQVMERPTVITANGKFATPKPVDFNNLVDQLHVGICKVWRRLEDAKIIKKEGGDVSSKDPLDILMVSKKEARKHETYLLFKKEKDEFLFFKPFVVSRLS